MSIKHKVLICTGAGEPDYTTSKSFIRALRRTTEHEVMTCGAMYKSSKETTEKTDIILEDREFPELYSYEEILDKCKPFRPDVIIQIEPHCYIYGEKPKDIKSFCWFLDCHRGGYAYRNLARCGHFDAVFIAQRFFAAAYMRNISDVYFLPQAFDRERIKYSSKITPECDIAFIGESGIAYLNYDKFDSDGFAYTNTIPNDLHLMSPYYKEYAERAHLLKRLSKDFDVRIYKKNFDNYSKIIQKGRIGFHRSLFKDVTLRLFEICACRRALACDYMPFLEEMFIDKQDCLMYYQFGFNHELENFELDYEQAHDAVKLLLEDNELRDKIAEQAQYYVYNKHTFDARVLDMFSVIDKYFMQGR